MTGGVEQVTGLIEAAASSGGLLLGILNFRAKSRDQFAERLEALVDLTPEELQHRLEADPDLAEFVGNTWNAAAASASDRKHQLLSRVAAAAVNGQIDPSIDNDTRRLLTPLLIDLEPEHVHVLVALQRPRTVPDGQMAGYVTFGSLTVDQLSHESGLPRTTVDIALSHLVHRGLAHEAPGTETSATEDKSWSATDVGNRLMVLLGDAVGPSLGCR